ncbi:MAG: response regulator [Treponema sp.]|jgi:YesN/AraC family two-component response regulator|nr:response regulator [Treponema sp.]
MFNILVADDEQNIRQSIVRILEEHFPGKAAVHQAANGLKALEMICAIPVDLIIADIKMPLCNGIELMRKLKSLGLRKQVIILSGFDNYDFVRETLKLGAEDYLLKPVAPEELCILAENCLANATRENLSTPGEDLMTGGHTFSRDNKEYRRLEQQYYFTQLAAGKAWEELFSFPRENDPVREAIFFAAMDSDELSTRIFTGLEYDTTTGCRIFRGTEGSYTGIAFVSRREELAEKRENLSRLLGNQCGRFGISEVEDIRHAAKAWQGALRELAKQFYDVREEWDPEEHYPFKEIKTQIINALYACSAEQLNPLLDRLFGLLRHDKLPVDEARRFLCSLVYGIMETDAGYIGIIGKYKFTGKDLVHVIHNETSASRVLRGMRECFDCYIRERLKLQEEQKAAGIEDYTVQRIKKFIEANYQHRISLGMISQKLEMHPNYLSTLFRQKTGVTYGCYLRHVRIEKAKTLIKMTNLKLYSVADQVGYNDNAHFYRAFKEETGISPIAYRNQNTGDS